MATSTQDVRASLIQSVEHCYYNGPTAGQMWLHDLSAYLQSLPTGDPQLERLDGHDLAGAEAYLCGQPHALVQAFDPAAWFDEYVAVTAPQR
jgi:hypothetical protein